MALVHVDQIMHMCTHMCIQRQTHMHVSTHSPACTHTTINTSTNTYTPRACLFEENSLNLLRNKHKFKNPGVSNFWFGSTDYKWVQSKVMVQWETYINIQKWIWRVFALKDLLKQKYCLNGTSFQPQIKPEIYLQKRHLNRSTYKKGKLPSNG